MATSAVPPSRFARGDPRPFTSGRICAYREPLSDQFPRQGAPLAAVPAPQPMPGPCSALPTGSEFRRFIARRQPTLMPRLPPVPVRLPLPAGRISGVDLREPAFASRPFFETALESEHLTAAE
jgi:hypothetical protein